MKPVWGDDYSICCCGSATQTGKEMQFFGARANLAKCLLYAINGGVDEKSHEQCGPNYAPITSEYLNYDEVLPKYVQMLDWLAGLYVNVLNLIQYMHDKYYYEEAEMALIDTDVRRTFATGIAGFSHVIDSLSAIKYAKVKVVRDESTAWPPAMRPRATSPSTATMTTASTRSACGCSSTFLEMIKKRHTYRNSEATTSILTITSNVVYGKYTGALPDGRAAFTPFAPGATPSYGAEQNGLLASLNSVAKLPYHWALDGISNTQTINPDALGHSEGERVENLVQVMDGYFDQGAHHLNVNVFGKEKLLDAMEHPKGRVRQLHHPRFRLRRQVHRPDPRAADGRHLPHLPCRPVIRSAMSTRWRASAQWTAPACALWCFCRGVPCGAKILPQPRDVGCRGWRGVDAGTVVPARVALPQLLGQKGRHHGQRRRAAAADGLRDGSSSRWRVPKGRAHGAGYRRAALPPR